MDEAGSLAGGLSRTLVLLDYPIAIAAIALAAVAGRPRALVWVAIALCAVTAVPGVVDQGDLDARPINAIPALGVLLAVALTLAAVRGEGAAFAPAAPGDRLRLALGAALLVMALPWLAAEAGLYFPGDVFAGEEVPAERDPGIAAVHPGVHHGYGGVLLAAAALLLSRVPRPRPLAAYLSLLLAYGLANAVQDTWNEQLWKRAWVDVEIPSMIRPDLTLGWLLIVGVGAAVYAFWFRPQRGR